MQKNRWRGPAIIVMREGYEEGKPRVYWVAHGTSLLRCSAEQIRPSIKNIGQDVPRNRINAQNAVSHL